MMFRVTTSMDNCRRSRRPTRAKANARKSLTARGTKSPKYTNSQKVNVAVVATDNVKVTGYYLGEGTEPPVPLSLEWLPSKPVGYTILSAHGTHTVRAWVKDAAGNISKPRKATIFLDPVKPNLSVATPPSGQHLNALTRIGGMVGETLPSSGIASGEYAILRRSDCSWWHPDTGQLVKGQCGNEQWVPFTIAVTAKAWSASIGRLEVKGKYNLLVRIIDRAGNVGLNKTRTFEIN